MQLKGEKIVANFLKDGQKAVESNFTGDSPSILVPLVLVVCRPNKNFTNDQKTSSSAGNWTKIESVGNKVSSGSQSADFTLENPTGQEEKERSEVKTLDRQLEQIKVFFSTLLFFSHSTFWRIIVFTDTEVTFRKISKLADDWPDYQKHRLILERREAEIPLPGKLSSLLKSHYRLCSWCKVFMDDLLPEFDSVVYMDTDIVFTGPAEKLWNKFEEFDKWQAIGMAPEPFYKLGNDRKYGGISGINSGVMLMNLTRLADVGEFGYSHKLLNTLMETKSLRHRHDQDVANYFLNSNPHLLKELTYKWNFIPSDCSANVTPECTDCDDGAIFIVHGADGSFFRDVDPKFKFLFRGLSHLAKTMSERPDLILNEIYTSVSAIETVLDVFICTPMPRLLDMMTHHLRKHAYNVNLDIRIPLPGKYVQPQRMIVDKVPD